MFHLQRIKILGVHKLPVIIQCLVDRIRRWIMPEHTSSGYQPDPANTGQPIAQGYLQSRPGIGREVFGATVAGKVTWHGPCHLGRGLGVTREPREIIAGLPGVEYVEAGELSSCGGGGVFSLTHYGLALKIGASRAKELAASGASVVATGCPSCRMHLEDMLGRLGSPIKVVHTVELLDGITPPTFRKKAKVFTANALP